MTKKNTSSSESGRVTVPKVQGEWAIEPYYGKDNRKGFSLVNYVKDERSVATSVAYHLVDSHYIIEETSVTGIEEIAIRHNQRNALSCCFDQNLKNLLSMAKLAEDITSLKF